MRILITDVTEMHQGNYCVAGWRAAKSIMVRPLPNGANWTAKLLAAHGIAPGATVRFKPSGVQPTGGYPHRTEDTLIDQSAITLISPGPGPWFGPDAPPTTATLADAFEGAIRNNRSWNGCLQGIYVPVGTRVRSLYAVAVARANLKFFEDGKLRAYLDDGSQRYNLAVSSRVLRETYRGGGVTAVTNSFPHAGRLHVRVGLARAWGDQPDKCYVMINGVYW